MHIAALKPEALDENRLDKEIINKELNVQKELIAKSGKPSNVIDKILEGKMNKYFSDVTLLNQPFILDTDKKVKDAIKDFSKNNNFKIMDYKLLILGEE